MPEFFNYQTVMTGAVFTVRIGINLQAIYRYNFFHKQKCNIAADCMGGYPNERQY